MKTVPPGAAWFCPVKQSAGLGVEAWMEDITDPELADGWSGWGTLSGTNPAIAQLTAFCIMP